MCIAQQSMLTPLKKNHNIRKVGWQFPQNQCRSNAPFQCHLSNSNINVTMPSSCLSWEGGKQTHSPSMTSSPEIPLVGSLRQHSCTAHAEWLQISAGCFHAEAVMSGQVNIAHQEHWGSQVSTSYRTLGAAVALYFRSSCHLSLQREQWPTILHNPSVRMSR